MAEKRFCPHCGSPLRSEVRPYAIGDLYLGRFPFYVCSVCARSYHPARTSRRIEKAAMELGVWGAEGEVEERALVFADNAGAVTAFTASYVAEPAAVKAEAKEDESSPIVTVLPSATKRRFVPASTPASNEVA